MKQKWFETLSNLDDSQGSKFIRHYWVSKHGRVQAGALYRAIRDSARTKAAVAQLSDDLLNHSFLYSALGLPDHELWNSRPQSVRNDIATLKLLNAQQCLPVLMAAYNNMTPDAFEKTIRLMVIMAVRYSLICAYRTGALEITYAEIAHSIFSRNITRAAQVRRALDQLYPNDSEFMQAFSNKEVRSAKHARFLLREIETYNHSGALAPVNDPALINLEHIAPKNKTNEWSSGIGSLQGDTYDVWVYKLGNQCLIEKNINHNLGTASFDNKKKAFCASQVPSTQSLSSHEHWTTTEISIRQAAQATNAVDIWKYDVPPTSDQSA
jgi:hypothetical protein